MLVKRKVVRDPSFIENLAANGIAEDDTRLAAAEWYICHSVRFGDAPVVGETAHGPLRCYRTRSIARRLPLTVYFYVSDGGMTVHLAGLMCPTIRGGSAGDEP